MKQASIIAIIIALAIGGAGGFYGGIIYQQSKNPMANFQRNGTNFRQFNQSNGASANGQRLSGGASSGEIIKKDDSSVTLKMNDGSSKTVYLSASTTISKFSEGSGSDLAVGENVMANGSSNSDGSITAQFIQLRPTGAGGPGFVLPGADQPAPNN